MHRLLFAVLLACGQREPTSIDRDVEVTVVSGSAAGPAIATDAGAAGAGGAAPEKRLAFPDKVGLPPPFDGLRPRMKHADALGVLVAAGVREASAIPAKLELRDQPVYETSVPGVFATLLFGAGRLEAVSFVTLEERHLLPVVDRWGKPATTADSPFFGFERTWPPSASGWKAHLLTKPVEEQTYAMYSGPRLELSVAAASPRTPSISEATGDVFHKLGGLLGAPLADAERVLPGVRRETADDDDQAPERADNRQGFAQLSVPWSSTTWELVLKPAGQSSSIGVALLSGKTTTEEQRVVLFDALRRAFGRPQAVVSPAGRVEIELLSPTVRVHCSENEGDWSIELRRR